MNNINNIVLCLCCFHNLQYILPNIPFFPYLLLKRYLAFKSQFKY